MAEETDIEHFFDGKYVNPKFVECIHEIYELENPEEMDKDFPYFFRINMNSGEFYDSISFKRKEECEYFRGKFVKIVADLLNK